MYNSKFRLEYQSMGNENETGYATSVTESRSFFAKHGMVLDDITRNIMVDLEKGQSFENWFPNKYDKIIVTRL